ncbi:hypothetical protein O3G_MSEX012853 [Manduca sexta]|uniref:La protein homolog n=1 Tax=Manduca sexta TaxID=7130 RepID=A0A921ZPK0_MANSE|nr:hypothetical protein O3G_MSEX012853 [Manduca sexta]KAG6461776.1 hypothetical protein O3G_MSEX012853 [Manduca sexta]
MTEEKEVAPETNGQENDEKNANVEEESELESAIIRQVEYYFGDLNLPRDKFLREQVKLDDGWVPIEVLTTFNRLKKLSKDVEVIANALHKSTSGLLEISEDNKKIRRSAEFPVPEMNEERRKDLLDRTIYAKGFDKNATLDDLLKYFKDYNAVENVVMRRYLDKSKKRLFKGSIFVTFKNREEAEKFINIKGLKYNDTELIVEWQGDYLKQKQEEYLAKKDSKDKKGKQKEKEQEKEEFTLPTGTILHFTDCTEKTTREHVKDALTAIGGEIAYIDFKLGDTKGWVRLLKEDSAKELAEKMTDGKLKIGETDVTFRVLEGEEERTFLDKTIEEMVKRRKNMKQNKHKGKNFKGKHGRKRRQDDGDEVPQKKVKADS